MTGTYLPVIEDARSLPPQRSRASAVQRESSDRLHYTVLGEANSGIERTHFPVLIELTRVPTYLHHSEAAASATADISCQSTYARVSNAVRVK